MTGDNHLSIITFLIIKNRTSHHALVRFFFALYLLKKLKSLFYNTIEFIPYCYFAGKFECNLYFTFFTTQVPLSRFSLQYCEKTTTVTKYL